MLLINIFFYLINSETCLINQTIRVTSAFNLDFCAFFSFSSDLMGSTVFLSSSVAVVMLSNSYFQECVSTNARRGPIDFDPVSDYHISYSCFTRCVGTYGSSLWADSRGVNKVSELNQTCCFNCSNVSNDGKNTICLTSEITSHKIILFHINLSNNHVREWCGMGLIKNMDTVSVTFSNFEGCTGNIPSSSSFYGLLLFDGSGSLVEIEKTNFVSNQAGYGHLINGIGYIVSLESVYFVQCSSLRAFF